MSLFYNDFIAKLRALSAIVVVLMHYGYCFPISYSALSFVGNGYYGVAMFFAISGFLITRNVLARYGSVAAIDLRDFYVMRAARIVPCLTLAVVLMAGLSLTTDLNGFVFPKPLNVPDAVVSVISLTFNRYYVAGANTLLSWGVLWSISIEEVFYIAYPLLAVALRKEKWLVIALIAVVIQGPIFRSNVNDLYSYIGCFDLLAMGALAAIASRRFTGRISAVTLTSLQITGALLAAGAYLFLGVREHFAIGPSLIALGASVMLFASDSHIKANETQRTFLGAVGSVSYEIYLFHTTIFLLIASVMPTKGYVMSYVAFVFVLIIGYWICKTIAVQFSVPLNSVIRRRFSERRVTLPK